MTPKLPSMDLDPVAENVSSRTDLVRLFIPRSHERGSGPSSGFTPKRSFASPTERSSNGFVLVLVLVIVMLASMVAASVLYLLRSEKTASAAGLSGEQAWATAMSGVYRAMSVAAPSANGSELWLDNPAMFKNQLVLDDGANQWYFSVYSVGDLNSSEIRFGLTDEASKINVTHADHGILERLPNLTPTSAQVLVEYAQSTNAVQPSAMEQSPGADPTVVSFIPARKLSCLDELLSVPGLSSALLYGEDANLNGNLDANEDDGEASPPPDNQDAQLEFGLRSLLTVSSYDLNVSNGGLVRHNLNDPLGESSGLELPATVLSYLEALRRQGLKLAHPADLLESSGKLKDEKGAEKNFASGVGKAELPMLLDRCTGTNAARLYGLVNLNTASAKVLAALPGCDAALAEAIVSARVGLSEDARRTPAWLFQEGLVNADLFKKLAPHLTTRSYQFHFHVLAYGVPAGTYRMLEAVIDTAVQPPAILLLRDLTRLGLPAGMGTIREPAKQNAAASSGTRVPPHRSAFQRTRPRQDALLRLRRVPRKPGNPSIQWQTCGQDLPRDLQVASPSAVRQISEPRARSACLTQKRRERRAPREILAVFEQVGLSPCGEKTGSTDSARCAALRFVRGRLFGFGSGALGSSVMICGCAAAFRFNDAPQIQSSHG